MHALEAALYRVDAEQPMQVVLSALGRRGGMHTRGTQSLKRWGMPTPRGWVPEGHAVNVLVHCADEVEPVEEVLVPSGQATQKEEPEEA